jgi:hypothetical protein
MILAEANHNLKVGSPEYRRMRYICRKYNISSEEYIKNTEMYEKDTKKFKQTNHGISRKSKEYTNMLYYTRKFNITVEEFIKNKDNYIKKKSRTKHLQYECNSFEYNKSIFLRRKYNIDLEEYYKILNEQNNQCAICKKSSTDLKYMLAVDHCHKTGKVRGLLCSHCNTGLGQFKDDPNLLQLAINYLK